MNTVSKLATALATAGLLRCCIEVLRPYMYAYIMHNNVLHCVLIVNELSFFPGKMHSSVKLL